MAASKGYKRLQLKDWQEVKDLLTQGLSDISVRIKTGRGLGTIHYIKHSTSFEDYRRIMAGLKDKYYQKRSKEDQGERILRGNLAALDISQQEPGTYKGSLEIHRAPSINKNPI